MNVTLLSGKIAIPRGTSKVSEAELMALLADYVSKMPSDEERAHHVDDFLQLLPNLNSGMHINIRFTSTTAFEYTRESAVFDIFPSLRLVHGWLVDPQDTALSSALGNLTFNQVTNELVRTAPPDNYPSDVAPSAPPPEAFSNDAVEVPEESLDTLKIREIRPFVMDFFANNPTQLTIYGLTELHSTLREKEIAILFRNSHFYVIIKHAGEIYTLVTDVGYLNLQNVVWEKLMDINGESSFYDQTFSPSTDPALIAAASVTPDKKPVPRPLNNQSVGYTRPSRPGSSNCPKRTPPPFKRQKEDKCCIQ